MEDKGIVDELSERGSYVLDVRKKDDLTKLKRSSCHCLFFGMQGSGKTLAMTYYAFNDFLNNGTNVYTNYPLNFPHRIIRDIKDMRRMMDDGGGIFLIDDCERWMSSKFKTNVEKKNLLDCCLDYGKSSISMWLSAKRPMEVDKSIRILCDKFIECTKVLKVLPDTVDEYYDMRRYLDFHMIKLETYSIVDLGKPELVSFLDDLDVWALLYDTSQRVDKLLS